MPRSLTACLVLLLTLFVAPGCLKMQVHWQLYPDGSGKVKMRSILRPPMLPGMGKGQSPEQMEQRLKAADPFKDFAGITIKPGSLVSSVEDGQLKHYVEGYFTDVNAVTRKGKPVMTFTQLDTGGYEAHYISEDDQERLKGLGGKARKVGGPRRPETPPDPEDPFAEDGTATPGEEDPPPAKPDPMQAMLKAALKGLEVKLFLKMPADLTETNVEKRNERTALLAITDAMLDDPAAQQRLAELDGVRARCGEPSSEQRQEFEVFQAELKQVLAEAAKAPADAPGTALPEEEK